MHASLALLALVGCAAASPAFLVARSYDDGQWRPELDGSILGSGALRWGLEDGSWKPAFDGSSLGRGDLTWLNRRKRDLYAVNANSLSHPLDEPITAAAKSAQLIQQQTEATRNILGGGIPLDLPADTPAVAAGKQAHAIAHENQKLLTSGGIYSSPVITSRIAAPIAVSHIAAAPYATHIAAAPVVARVATPAYAYGITSPAYAVAHPYGYAIPAIY